MIPCSVPGWGTKIPQAERPGQKLKIQKKKKISIDKCDLEGKGELENAASKVQRTHIAGGNLKWCWS